MASRHQWLVFDSFCPNQPFIHSLSHCLCPIFSLCLAPPQCNVPLSPVICCRPMSNHQHNYIDDGGTSKDDATTQNRQTQFGSSLQSTATRSIGNESVCIYWAKISIQSLSFYYFGQINNLQPATSLFYLSKEFIMRIIIKVDKKIRSSLCACLHAPNL